MTRQPGANRVPQRARRCAALYLAFAASACTAGPEREAAPRLLAARATLVDHHLLSGELAAERAVPITAPDIGVRPLEIRWLVANGTPVEAGDRLFEFDNSQLALAVEERRLAVLEAEAELAAGRSEAGSGLAEAEFALERAQAELEKARIDAAIPPGIRSEEEYERLQTALRKAERSVADSERALASARALTAADVEKTGLELEEARSKLRQVEGGIAALGVRAPQSGVLLLERNAREERLWETGDTIYPGEKLATLPDLSTLVVRARLFDVDDGAIEPGSAATVTLDPYPELEYTGTVRRVDAVAFQRQRDSSTRVFWVIVDLDDVDPRAMRPGLSARVRVERQRTDGESVVVPRQSMDLTDLAAPRVLLADGSWRAVTLGPCGPLECVVLAGIEAGAAVGRVTRFAPAGAVSEAR